MFRLEEIFQKFVQPVLVCIIVFVIILIDSIYQTCIPFGSFSKRAFSHLYRINIWKFGISMVIIKQMVSELIKNLIIFLIYVTWAKYPHTFRRKVICSYVHSSIQAKKVETYWKMTLQSGIYNLAKCLWWSLSAKMQRLKASSQIFKMVLNTPLRLCKILKSIWNKWIPKS